MTTKRILRALGWIVSLACVALFIRQIQLSGLATPGRSAVENLLLVLAGAVAYGAAVALLAALWAGLALPGVGRGDPRWQPLFKAYMLGQFAKYLPGNVFQYAARHGLGLRAGVGHAVLASAAVAEVYLLLCAGSALSFGLGLPIVEALAPEWPKIPSSLALLPLLAAFVLCLPRRFARIPDWLPVHPPGQIARALGGYLAFFLIFGGLYAMCLAWSQPTRPEVLPAIGTAAVAWVAGFVLPGAPAGAGLREVALSMGNNGLKLSGEEALAAILLFRLMTLGGDALAFVAGWLARNPAPAEPARTQE